MHINKFVKINDVSLFPIVSRVVGEFFECAAVISSEGSAPYISRASYTQPRVLLLEHASRACATECEVVRAVSVDDVLCGVCR